MKKDKLVEFLKDSKYSPPVEVVEPPKTKRKEKK